MATPLKLKNADGDIQEFTTADENYLAYQIGLHLLDDSANGFGKLTKNDSDDTLVGNLVNTFFNEPVGTSSGTSITTGSTTTFLSQSLGTASEADSDILEPLKWIDSTADGPAGFRQMDDTDLNTAVDRYLTTIFTNDYPGTFYLSDSAPSGDYAVHLSNVFTDTRTDGTSVPYNVYRKTTVTAPAAVNPMYVSDSAGGSGIAIKPMTDRQIRFSFGQRAKTRIGQSKIGTYQLRSSTAGAPTDPGTWVSKGSVTDTKQQTSDVVYTTDSTIAYQAIYTKSYTDPYTRNYDKTYTINYENVYSKDYTRKYERNFARAYENNYIPTYTGPNYVANYEAATYARVYSLSYTRSQIFPYEKKYTMGGTYTGDPLATYDGRIMYDSYIQDQVQYVGTLEAIQTAFPYTVSFASYNRSFVDGSPPLTAGTFLNSAELRQYVNMGSFVNDQGHYVGDENPYMSGPDYERTVNILDLYDTPGADTAYTGFKTLTFGGPVYGGPIGGATQQYTANESLDEATFDGRGQIFGITKYVKGQYSKNYVGYADNYDEFVGGAGGGLNYGRFYTEAYVPDTLTIYYQGTEFGGAVAYTGTRRFNSQALTEYEGNFGRSYQRGYVTVHYQRSYVGAGGTQFDNIDFPAYTGPATGGGYMGPHEFASERQVDPTGAFRYGIEPSYDSVPAGPGNRYTRETQMYTRITNVGINQYVGPAQSYGLYAPSSGGADFYDPTQHYVGGGTEDYAGAIYYQGQDGGYLIFDRYITGPAYLGETAYDQEVGETLYNSVGYVVGPGLIVPGPQGASKEAYYTTYDATPYGAGGFVGGFKKYAHDLGPGVLQYGGATTRYESGAPYAEGHTVDYFGGATAQFQNLLYTRTRILQEDDRNPRGSSSRHSYDSTAFYTGPVMFVDNVGGEYLGGPNIHQYQRELLYERYPLNTFYQGTYDAPDNYVRGFGTGTTSPYVRNFDVPGPYTANYGNFGYVNPSFQVFVAGVPGYTGTRQFLQVQAQAGPIGSYEGLLPADNVYNLYVTAAYIYPTYTGAPTYEARSGFIDTQGGYESIYIDGYVGTDSFRNYEGTYIHFSTVFPVGPKYYLRNYATTTGFNAEYVGTAYTINYEAADNYLGAQYQKGPYTLNQIYQANTNYERNLTFAGPTYTGAYDSNYARNFVRYYDVLYDHLFGASYAGTQTFVGGDSAYIRNYVLVRFFTRQFAVGYNRQFGPFFGGSNITYVGNYIRERTIPVNYTTQYVGERVITQFYVSTYENIYTRSYISNVQKSYARNFAATFTGSYTRLVGYQQAENYTRTTTYTGPNFTGSYEAAAFYVALFEIAQYSRRFGENKRFDDVYVEGTLNEYAVYYINEGQFLQRYTNNYAVSGIGDYVKATYARNYILDFASIAYNPNFDGPGFGANYTTEYVGGYDKSFVAYYAKDYIGDYTAVYEKDYIGDYITDYATDYIGNYIGNFEGETIQATDETIETFTLYVRIA